MCGRYHIDSRVSGALAGLKLGAVSQDGSESIRGGSSDSIPDTYTDSALELSANISANLASGTSINLPSDIRPSELAPVLLAQDGRLCIEHMLWGFPGFQGKGLVINARAETLLDKKMFRDSALARRCAIPAAHFYEWDSGKNRVEFCPADADTLYMAGLYQYIQGERHFVIITTQANASVRRIHHRMPLILEADELSSWIQKPELLHTILQKTPAPLSKRQTYEQLSLF